MHKFAGCVRRKYRAARQLNLSLDPLTTMRGCTLIVENLIGGSEDALESFNTVISGF